MCKTFGPDLQALSQQEPQVISVSFYRESVQQRLGLKLGKKGGDVYVAALDGRNDSMLLISTTTTMPIRVGDIVTAFNGQACYGVDLETLKFTMSQSTGLLTIVLRKTVGAALQDKVKQAFFMTPKAYTCLPMDIDFRMDNQQPKNNLLTIASLNAQNEWLLKSCLRTGQVVLDINGTSSYQLEEEDAQVFLQTRNELDPYLSIKTFTPSSMKPPILMTTRNNPNDENDDSGAEEERNSTGQSYLKNQRQRIRQMLNNNKRRQVAVVTATEKELPKGGAGTSESRMRQVWKREGMETYVVQQTARFQEILNESKTETITIDEKGELPVMASCRTLFIAMKQSIDKCRKEGTTGESYFRLYQSFGNVLQQYAQLLMHRHMSVKSFRRPRIQKIRLLVSSSSSSSVALADDGEVSLCHMVATTKYCADTVELMEELIQETIDDEYKSNIDMTPQQEAFDDVTAKAMTLLVSGLHHRLVKSSFRTMGRLSWATWEQVDDTNKYVYSMCEEIQGYMDTATKLLPTPYFLSLCDKVAVDVADTFYSTMIVKCNRANAAAKQQLLLDIYSLKSFFISKTLADLLQTKETRASSTVALYERMVLEKFQKIESLLKTAACSDSDLQDFLNNVI
eukprot:scaffold9078_cov129-Cylindrotheca_fusiformis.AAC.2